MGLVLQNTMDALVPVAEPAVTAPVGTVGTAPTDGLFANLLASLSATLESEATDMAMDPDALPGAGSEDEETNPVTAELLAALFAATAPLAVKPEGTAATAEAGTEALTTVSAAGGEAIATTVTPEANAAVADSSPDAVAAPPQGAASEAPEVTPEPAGQPTEASQSPAATVPLQEPQTTPEPPPPVDQVQRPETEGPPAETEAPTETTSVVRPVGNAETETADEGAARGNSGRKDEVERPQPRASARAIEQAAANSAVGQLRETQTAPVDAPAAPAEAPAPPPADVPQQVEQVATTVIEQVEAGGGEARIHLDPLDLGELTIHVRTDGDGVRVEVRAERAEAAQLLRDHTQDLSQLLGQRGLNLSDVNVGLGRGNGQQAWGQDGRPENRPGAGEFASILNGGEGAPLETHHRLRAAYNPDGAHLYRV